jgi:hypothetical protein
MDPERSATKMISPENSAVDMWDEKRSLGHNVTIMAE